MNRIHCRNLRAITESNAGEPRPLAIRTRWASRVAQFPRWG